MTQQQRQPQAAVIGPPDEERNWRSLHIINRAFITADREGEAAQAMLEFLPDLLPDLESAGVYRVSGEWTLTPLEVRSYLPEGSHNLAAVDHLPEPAEISGWRSGEVHLQGNDLYLPAKTAEKLVGLVHIRFKKPAALRPANQEILEHAAGSLALSLLALQKQQVGRDWRREAELMQDMLGALASSADLNQSLEILLVNLRAHVNYDQARLFLLEDTSHGAGLAYFRSGDPVGRGMFSPADPVVAELRQLHQPMILGDVTGDHRFRNWPDMETVRGWLGVPIFAGEEMVGFLSLGSLRSEYFKPTDAELVKIVADQLGHILERSWLHEQSHRQSEELEVLSKITFALGQVDSEESIFPAILEQIAKFYGAVGGTFLFPDQFETNLYVRYSDDPALIGMFLPAAEDVFWKVFRTGQTRILKKVPTFLKKNNAELYQRLLASSNSAALIPLANKSSNYGLLLLLFDDPVPTLADNLELLDTIASITGTFLYRAIFLDGLEKQLQVRTRQLNALYNLNQVAGRSTDSGELLADLLEIILEVMGSEAGFIMLLDSDGQELELAAQHSITENLQEYFAGFTFQKAFWEEMLSASSPLVVPNILEEPRLPEDFKLLDWHGRNACILAPLRARHQSLGLVGIINDSVLDYTIEDLNLFINLTDQLGSAVERTNLASQARQAAVIEERQRLARELHDSVTQLIYSQVLFAGAALRVLGQGNLDVLRQNLVRLDEGAQQALKEMRLLVYELRPAVYLQEGLVAALERRLDAVEKRGGINASLQVFGNLSLDEAMELSIYRILEEALNNTLKHSSAKNVAIKIESRRDLLVLEIRDDGSGFDPEHLAAQGGMGLQNIRERTEELGGKITIETGPMQGTRLVITVGID